MTNPPIQSDSTKERGWRGAETPAMNGHGNAHSLARMAAVMACGGELDVPRDEDAALAGEGTQTEEDSEGLDSLCRGEYMGFAPTGKKIEMNNTFIVKVVANKLVE